MWGVYLAFFPGKWLLSGVAARLPHHHTPEVFAIAGTVWMAAFVVSSFWVAEWPCPRCHNTFAKATWYRNPCTRYCLSCGLRRWAPDGADPSTPS
jgi:hypothetical protein